MSGDRIAPGEPDPGHAGSGQFAGQVAVVTGAARAIDASITMRLAAEGASIIGADLRDLKGTGAAVSASGGSFTGYR